MQSVSPGYIVLGRLPIRLDMEDGDNQIRSSTLPGAAETIHTRSHRSISRTSPHHGGVLAESLRRALLCQSSGLGLRLYY